MKTIMTGILAGTLIAGTASAESPSFNADQVGAAPAGWLCGSTGGGAPRWTVETEAPGGAKVLKQSGAGPFPWCVKQGTSLADGVVEVKFKPLSGREGVCAPIVRGCLRAREKDAEAKTAHNHIPFPR